LIHEHACVADGSERPFIKLDCSSSQDLELELFGVREPNGDAAARSLERVSRTSYMYQARGGTLFIQNVAALPARAQTRFARVLRDGEAALVEDGQATDIDLRVITAGEPSLEAATAEGDMREDLFKRLAAFRLNVPPLRERREDIPALAVHFVALLCERANVPCKELTDSAQHMLAALPWKRGNTTELCSLLENLVLRTAAPSIGLDDVLSVVQLEAQAAWFPVGFSLRDARSRFEREYIAAVLAQHHGRVPDAARTLGIQRSNLYRKMRHLNVPPKKKH
jgi:DNA-binding NtrC family response regulator